jgi:HK97 family phage major capsid protein
MPTVTKEQLDLVEKASEIVDENSRLKTENERMKKALAKANNLTPAYEQKVLGTDTVPAVAKSADNAWGFRSFGDFAHEVRLSRLGGAPTETIKKSFGSSYVQKAATGMGELVGSDGGFLVPPEYSSKIFERVYKQNDLLARTDKYPVSGNSMVFPRNAESSRANGSRWGGVRAYWVQEGSSITRSSPTFGRHTLTLNKLACLARVTDELLQDAPTLNAYLNRVFPDEINFVVGDSLINGTGAGQPLGILNAPCTVSVAKETGQLAATISTQNITKMWARLFRGMAAGENSGAAWYINQDVCPQLQTLTLGIGTAGVTTYMPPGGLSGKPYATLMGAPVIETEWNPTLGTVGDIILADMSQMVSISKAMESAQSMHLYFDTDETAFRVLFRMAAAPWMATAVTPFKGSNTQSAFVTLATRA